MDSNLLLLHGWLWIPAITLLFERRRTQYLLWLIFLCLSVLEQNCINPPGPGNTVCPTAPSAVAFGTVIWLVFRVVLLGLRMVPEGGTVRRV